MKKLIRMAPPNSLFFLENGGDRGDEPDFGDRTITIWSTGSCILVGTLCFMDGKPS